MKNFALNTQLPNLSAFFGRFANGFSEGEKLVACFLKLVARISKSEPLIFSLLPCEVYVLKTGSRFSVSFFIRFTYRQRRFSFPPNSTRCFLLIAQKSLKWLHRCNLFNDFPAEFCAHKGIAPAPAGGLSVFCLRFSGVSQTGFQRSKKYV